MVDIPTDLLARENARRQKEIQTQLNQMTKEGKFFRASLKEFLNKQKQALTQEGKLTVGEGLVSRVGTKTATGVGIGAAGLTQLLTGGKSPLLAALAGVAAGGLTKGLGVIGKGIVNQRVAKRERDLEKKRFEEFGAEITAGIINAEREKEGKSALAGAALDTKIEQLLNDSRFADIISERVKIEGDSLEEEKATREENERQTALLEELRVLSVGEQKKEKVQRLGKAEEKLEKKRQEKAAMITGQTVAGQRKRGGSFNLPGFLGLGLIGLGTGVATVAGALAAAGVAAGPILAGGAALGGGLGAFFALGGLGVAAGIALISESLKNVQEPLESLSRGIKSFEELDGKKLSEVGKGMSDFPFTSLITAGIGNLIAELSETPVEESLGSLARGLKQFDQIDAQRLTETGEAVRKFPLFSSISQGAILSGISGFIEALTGKSIGTVIADFVGGLKRFEDLNAPTILKTGTALRTLGGDLQAFSSTFSESFLKSFVAGINSVFGVTTIEKIRALAKVGPELIQATEGLRTLKELGKIDFKFNFETDARSLRNLRRFVRQAANLREAIGANTLLREEQALRRQPLIVSPSTAINNNTVQRSGDIYSAPPRSGVADGTFTRAISR